MATDLQQHKKIREKMNISDQFVAYFFETFLSETYGFIYIYICNGCAACRIQGKQTNRNLTCVSWRSVKSNCPFKPLSTPNQCFAAVVLNLQYVCQWGTWGSLSGEQGFWFCLFTCIGGGK